ncbi:cupin domain-containing protein [Kitasatospora sp. NBC_01287]|uniref:cupin domain-containing protein n=1 Tax=Kitasatospora sp. NBC_01287 TaxID=2903573 RepID=UPI00224D1F7B|nr:cupin domain-containing protein [Kitasatospora sp. NBC_01287]MCX4751376.1 cupin domain-containing protein [Kitasatospora sp. NBC_01287]
MRVIAKSGLPSVVIDGETAAHIFQGVSAGTTVSAFIVDVAGQVGPDRHTHPYDEVFVIVEGNVRIEAGDEVVDGTPEQIVVVEARVPHTFYNLGPGPARMVNIHAAERAVTEFTADRHGHNDSYQYAREN